MRLGDDGLYYRAVNTLSSTSSYGKKEIVNHSQELADEDGLAIAGQVDRDLEDTEAFLARAISSNPSAGPLAIQNVASLSNSPPHASRRNRAVDLAPHMAAEEKLQKAIKLAEKLCDMSETWTGDVKFKQAQQERLVMPHLKKSAPCFYFHLKRAISTPLSFGIGGLQL